VRTCHDIVTAMGDPGDGAAGEEGPARFAAAVDDLVEATDQLLTFEDRLPVLRDLPARALSAQVVRAASFAATLGGLLVLLGIWREILSRWWAPTIVLALIAASTMASLAVAPAAGRHRRQRYLATACGAAGLLLGPAIVLRGWPAGVVCAGLQAGFLALLLDLPKGRA
jgi:hypothetical protein